MQPNTACSSSRYISQPSVTQSRDVWHQVEMAHASVGCMYGRPRMTECDMHYARASVMECDYHAYVCK